MEYTEKLKSIHDIGEQARKENSEYESAASSMKDELSRYKDIIPEFFSSRGEAKGIHDMYVFMEEHPNDLRTISVIDLCVAGKIYKEYVDGMLQFINEITEKEPTEAEASDYSGKISIASANNDKFVASLFGGAPNEPKRKTLREASVNIEYLIDFIDELGSFMETVDALKMPASDGVLRKLAADSTYMYFNSISMYCYSVINCVFETYDQIREIIQYPYGKPTTADVPKYQLFA